MKNLAERVLRILSVSFCFIVLNFGFLKADESGTIKMPKHNWSSQLVGAEIICMIFEKVGEKCEYIDTDSLSVYQSMADGEIDIVHEIWEGAFGKFYDKAKTNGDIEEILTHDAVVKQGWWYPVYVEGVCPGLPHWKALLKCSDKFATTNSEGKGVFVAGPVDWLKHDAEKIEAFRLNFIVKNMTSANSIWEELDVAVAQQKPIIIFNWSPNFIGEKYKGKFVKFPKFDIKCITDPSWGINSNLLYDCAHSSDGYLKLAVNKNFRKNHPRAYDVVKNINFSGTDIEKMANYVETDKLKITEAAQKWLEDHKNKWSKWIK